MAKSASYYNVDDFIKYKRTQIKCIPPRSNILAAATHMQTVLDAKKLTYGFMGGLPMLCLGHMREISDLHITYDGRDFERLQAKLGADRRVRLPIGMNPLLPFKILVWTGPSYKDTGCTVDATVELDLVPSGSCGSPATNALEQNLVFLGLRTTSGEQFVFKSLNMQYQMATLLSYCKARDLLWDPRKDILYLCKQRTEQVKRTRGQLNSKEVKELFLGTGFFSRLHMEDQRMCYRALLDTEPPPTMSITPPVLQKVAQSQQKSGYLDHKADAKLPDSQYRHITAQRRSSSGTADQHAMNQTRLQSAEHLQHPRRFSHIEGVQVVISAKPQTVVVKPPTKSARKSMPNLAMAHHDTSRVSTRQQSHAHIHAPSSIPQPNHASSKLDFGADYRPAYMGHQSNNQNHRQVIKPGHKTQTGSLDPTDTNLTKMAANGVRSQEGSLHTVSPEPEQVPRQQYFADQSTSMGRELHLVGPEGVYDAPQRLQETIQVLAEHPRHRSAPPLQIQSAFVFELDATAPMNPTSVAELPGDSIMPSSAEQNTAQCGMLTQTQNTSRPFSGRASSAPLSHGPLPASLVAGRPGLYVHHQPFSHRDPSEEPTTTISTRQTNAYRYSSCVCSPSTSLKHAQQGPNVPLYKAYRPFVMTNELDRSDSVSSIYSPSHRRNASDDSTASHDSAKLAMEYQELINFREVTGATDNYSR